MENYPVLIHIPHSSIYIPDDIREDIILDEYNLRKESLLLTDRYTDELFETENVFFHKNNYSRLVFDPERFRNDDDEFMSAYGTGVVYCKTSAGDVLREQNAEKRSAMLEKYYDPYHEELTQKVDNILGSYGRCLIVDGHSFPSHPLMFEKNKEKPRPDICIGTDEYHTPDNITIQLENFIHDNGYSTDRNHPFGGSLVPMKFYRKNKNIISVMIEINRRLYMDESNGEKSRTFNQIKDFIQNLTKFLIENFCSGGLSG